jgi:hypothetical protein
MSWWIRRKTEDQKTHLWAVDIDPLLPLVLLSLLLALIFRNAHSLALNNASTVLMFSGFICFLISKVSLFRQGIRVSWGPSQMDKRYSTLYRVGYGLMLSGVCLRLLLYGFSLVPVK